MEEKKEPFLTLKVTKLSDIVIESKYEAFDKLQMKLNDLKENEITEIKDWIIKIAPNEVSYEAIAQELNSHAKMRIKNLENYSKLAISIANKVPKFADYLLKYSRSRMLRSLFVNGLFSKEKILEFLERNVKQTGFFLPEVPYPPVQFQQTKNASKLKGVEDKLRENDWNLFYQVIRYGYKIGSIRYDLKYDNVDRVCEYVNNNPGFIKEHLADSIFGEFDEKADCYIAEEDGNLTPLAFACFYGSEKCVSYLLPMYKEIENNVPIMAVRSGSIKIYEEIKKVHPDVSNLLHQAIFWRHHSLFDRMIADSQLQTFPLSFCCSSGDLRMVVFFIENGADVNAFSGRDTPLTAACTRNRYYIAKYLIEKGANVNAPDKQGEPPIIKAITNNSIDVLKLLIENKADITVHAKKNQTLLDICTTYNAYEAAEILLQMGYVVEPSDNILANPISKNNSKMLKYLEEHGFDIILKCTPREIQAHLFWSIMSHDVENVKKFIKLGADVNEKYKKKTALFEAIKAKDLEILKLIVESGADLETKNSNFFEYALNNSSKEIVQYLRQFVKFDTHRHKQKPEKPKMAIDDFEVAIPYLTEKAMIERIESGQGQITENDSMGRSLLHLAVMYGYYDLEQLLLSKYLDINAVDKNGCTPLHIALLSKHEDAAKILISKRAKIEEKDKYGRTPLHIAAQNDLISVAQLLIKQGCYLNPTSETVGTPLSLATSREMKELLAKNGGV